MVAPNANNERTGRIRFRCSRNFQEYMEKSCERGFLSCPVVTHLIFGPSWRGHVSISGSGKRFFHLTVEFRRDVGTRESERFSGAETRGIC